MRNFLRQYAAYSFGVAINRFSALLLLPLYTRFLLPTDYGILDTLVTFTTLLQPMLLLGIDTAIQILFYDVKVIERSARDNLFVTSVLIVVTCASAFTITGLISTSFFVQMLFGDLQHTFQLRLLCIDMFVVSLFKLFHDNLRLRQQPWLYNGVSLLQLILMTILNIFFVVIQRRGVIGYIYGLVLADMVVMLLTGAFVIYYHRRGKVTLQYISPLLKIGLPLVPANLAYWVLSLSDRFFLIKMSTADEVGIYGIANRLAASIGIFTVAMQIGWRPFALSIQAQPFARTQYAIAPIYYLAVVGWLGLLIATLSPLLVKVFATPQYIQATTFLTPLLLAQIAYGAYFIFSTGIEITKQTYHLTWTVFVAAFFNILLNLLLIPHFKAFGASLATCGAYISATVIVAFVSQAVYPLPYPTYRLIAVCSVLISAYAIMIVLFWLNVASIVLTGFLICICSAVLILIIFRTDILRGFESLRTSFILHSNTD